MFLFRKAPAMPTPAEALPGRPDPHRHPRAAPRQRRPARAAVARRHPDRDLRPRLLLGRREDVLADARRDLDRGRLRRRLDAQSDLPGGLLRQDRPRRGGPGRLRPERVTYEELLRVFWEDHDPTQGMRQGNDVGTQYRSIILVGNDAERRIAEASRDAYAERLKAAGFGDITTEIVDAAANAVLLRRGLPPAVPGEEPRERTARTTRPA